MNQLLKTDQMAVGDVVPTRELTTIRDSRITVPTPDALTHLQLRRYAGCPICNLHLRSVAKRHDEIVAAGIRDVVISHSRAEDMRPHQASCRSTRSPTRSGCYIGSSALRPQSAP
jgi:hypothetical protein